MQTEIEVKFLAINHEIMRKRLQATGAVCEQPMRVMRRAIIDYPDRRLQTGDPWSFVRVRDEGHHVTVTYKQLSSVAAVDGAKEIETEVKNFDAVVGIFEAIGLKCFSLQESKRETWKVGKTEVVLDEWPWLKPYIEIEGESEAELKRVAQLLRLEWDKAVFGDAMAAYRAEYPHLTDQDTLGILPSVKFGDPLPDLLKMQK